MEFKASLTDIFGFIGQATVLFIYIYITIERKTMIMNRYMD